MHVKMHVTDHGARSENQHSDRRFGRKLDVLRYQSMR